jgi:Carboxypeptidase regulatory-like domain
MAKRGWASHLASLGWLAVLLLPGAQSGLHAQAVSQISGMVADQSGAAIADVMITATQTDTDVKRTAVSDASGFYLLQNLPLGPYRIEASKSGFTTFIRTGIILQVDSSANVPITMGVGSVTQTVEVSATASLVETRNMGVGNVVETQRILDLPLNGRNTEQLITLNGAASTTGTSPQWGMAMGYQISVAGGVSYGVFYGLDGANISNFYDATSFPLPFPDALQEFKLETSSLT